MADDDCNDEFALSDADVEQLDEALSDDKALNSADDDTVVDDEKAKKVRK
jgi:hypothetical protein